MAKGFVDVDDILNNFYPSFFVWHNKMYDTTIRLVDLVHYKIPEIIQAEMPIAQARLDEFCRSDDFLLMKPDPAAVVGCFSMHYTGHTLHVLTSRHDDIRDHTRQWVPLHFPEVFRSIVFASNIYTTKASGVPKHQTLAEEEADFYVEDNLDLALAAAPHVKWVFLIDKPWNQCKHLPKNVIRCTWFEVSAHVRSLFPLE